MTEGAKRGRFWRARFGWVLAACSIGMAAGRTGIAGGVVPPAATPAETAPAAPTPAASSAPPAPAPAVAGLRATFIGNMGVHLTDGKVAVMTDFPYLSGAFGYMTWSKDTVPGGPAPLCVFTHSHADHFAAALVREFCGAVLGPKDTTQVPGVDALAAAPEVTWKGIRFHLIATPHRGLEHYSYLVEWSGKRLYFTGDTGEVNALVGAKNLDAAFVSPWLLDAVREKGLRIDARKVVVYHHRGGEAIADFQGRVVPAPGQVIEL